MRNRDRGYGRCRSFSTHIDTRCSARKKRDWVLAVSVFHRKGSAVTFLAFVDPNVWGYGWFKTRGIM